MGGEGNFSIYIDALVAIILVITFSVLISGNKYVPKAAYPIVVIVFVSLFMTTVYFPYDRLLLGYPAIYSIFNTFQFPWRFLLVATVLIVALFAYLMSVNGDLNRSVKAALMASALFITVFQSTWYMNDYYLQADRARYVGVDNVDHYLYFIEYGLVDSDRDLTRNIPAVVSDDAGVVINSSSRRGYDFNIDVTNSSGEESSLLVPVWAYKGMRADCDDGALELSAGDNNVLSVSVPEGYSGNVHVYFGELWYWRLAEVVSVASLVVLVGYWVKGGVLRRKGR